MPFEDVCEKRLKARKRESKPKRFEDAPKLPAASKATGIGGCVIL